MTRRASFAHPDEAMTRPTGFADPDETATQAFPRAGGHPGAWPADLSAGQNGGPNGRGDDSTQMLPGRNGRSADMAYGSGGPPGGAGGSAGGAGGTERPAARRRRWLVLAGASLALFLVVMAGVTVVELIAGKPLNSLLTGTGGSGTSVSHIFGGRDATSAPAPTTSRTAPATSHQPTSTPTPTASSPSQSSSGAPTPTPTPSSSSPAPTPTPTPSTGVSGPPASSGAPNPAATRSQAP